MLSGHGRYEYSSITARPDYSWRDYGNRVGIWRLFELLDQLGIPAEAQMNTEVYAIAPDIPARLRARGDEILGHGVTNSDEQGHLGEEEERELIERVTATIARHEGKRPAGWMSFAGIPRWTSKSLTLKARCRESVSLY